MTEGVLIILGTVTGQFALACFLAWRLVRSEIKAELAELTKAQKASKTIEANHAEVLQSHGQALQSLKADRTKRGLGG